MLSKSSFCFIEILPSFASSSEPANIPAFPVLFKFIDDLKLSGISSEISFHSLRFPKNSFILLIPSSVLKQVT